MCGSKKNLFLARKYPDDEKLKPSHKDYKKQAKEKIPYCKKCFIETFRRPVLDGHGTPANYRRRGCRCQKCVAAYNQYQKEWREEKRLPAKVRRERRLRRRLNNTIRRKGFAHLFGTVALDPQSTK